MLFSHVFFKKKNLLLIKTKQKLLGIGLDVTSETFGMVSPSAAAFTQSDQTEVVDKPSSSETVCDTPGCVLAGKLIIYSIIIMANKNAN